MWKFALAAGAIVLAAATPGAAAGPAKTYRCANLAGQANHYKLGASEIRFWRAPVRSWSDNWCAEAGATCRATTDGGLEAKGEDWTMTFSAAGALMVSTDAADEELSCTLIEGDPPGR